jgi:hypothetical protein
MKKRKPIDELFKSEIEMVFNLTKSERTILLCKLAVKEHLNSLEPNEIIQLATIQSIRTANGEIEKVLKDWEKHPDLKC